MRDHFCNLTLNTRRARERVLFLSRLTRTVTSVPVSLEVERARQRDGAHASAQSIIGPGWAGHSRQCASQGGSRAPPYRQRRSTTSVQHASRSRAATHPCAGGTCSCGSGGSAPRSARSAPPVPPARWRARARRAGQTGRRCRPTRRPCRRARLTRVRPGLSPRQGLGFRARYPSPGAKPALLDAPKKPPTTRRPVSRTHPLPTHSRADSPKSPTRKLVTQLPQCTEPSRSK